MTDMGICGKCMGSGYGGHPDSGVLCYDCNGSGGIRADLSPSPEVVKELVEALRKLRSYNADILARRINYRPEDHIAVADAALAKLEGGE